MRYVIRSPEGGYLNDFVVVRTRTVTLNGTYVGTESDLHPTFKANEPRLALKFDTEADALTRIANVDPLHGGPEAFKGCTVEPTEE
ncbi:MAG TPA: hypothetical protein VFB54_07275 [Burkholderiales bacterium]|nr:hypothetical protein [Burkholderiales bacterium]